MNVTVRLFAGLRCENTELPCYSKTEFNVDLAAEMTLESFLRHLDIPLDQVKIILVNGLFKPMEYTLQDGDELAVFPPVGGG